MKRGAKIGLGVAGALVVLLAVGGFVAFKYLAAPLEAAAYADPDPRESLDANAAVADALAAHGIADAVVDVTPERAFVAYALPPFESTREDADDAGAHTGGEPGGNATEPAASDEAYADSVQRLVLVAVGVAAPASETVVLVQSHDGGTVTWTVPMVALSAFFDGESTLEELEAAIERT